jgi:hypothetical protein
VRSAGGAFGIGVSGGSGGGLHEHKCAELKEEKEQPHFVQLRK